MEIKSILDESFNQKKYETHFNQALENNALIKMKYILENLLYVPTKEHLYQIRNLKDDGVPYKKHFVDKIKEAALENTQLINNPNDFFKKQIDLGNYNRASKLLQFVSPTPELITLLRENRKELSNQIPTLINSYRTLEKENQPDKNKMELDQIRDKTVANKRSSQSCDELIFGLMEKVFISAVDKKDFKTINLLHDDGFQPNIFRYEAFDKLKKLSPDEKVLVHSLFNSPSVSPFKEKQPEYYNAQFHKDPILKHETNILKDTFNIPDNRNSNSLNI